MRKRMLVASLAIGLGAWVVFGCGYKKPPPPPALTGRVASFISDAPFCGVLSFRTQVTGLKLTLQGTTSEYPVFGTGSSRSPSYKVNFGELRDFSTLLDLGLVAVGTYDKLTLTFSFGQITIFNPLQSPSIAITNASFTTLSPQVSIQPPLVVTEGKVSALRIDFDLRRSIAVDALGQVTGDIKPVLTATAVTAWPDGGFGELDDMTGIVTSVSTAITSTGFIGGFGFQSLSGTAPLVAADLSNINQICGPVTASNQPCQPIILSELLTGSFVELDGFFDSNANLLAKSVEVEDQEIPEQNHIALIGDITSVTEDASGNVTQFNLYVSDEEPNDEARISMDSTVVVNLSPSTIYQASSRSTNFADLSVDATALAPGERVVVHGVFTPPPTSTTLPTTVVANKAYVKLHSYQGNFSSLAAPPADDKTGGFWLQTCSPLFNNHPILVITRGPLSSDSFQTTFVNVIGLNGLTPQPSLLVKGLLFFELHGGIVNGVNVPPGTLVLLAKQVHEIQ